MVSQPLMLFAEQGRGTPIVFLHGFGSSGLAFQHRIFPWIPKNRFRCIAPDFFGFGDSAPLPFSKNHTVNSYARGVLDLLDSLSLSKVFLVGTSLGGAVSLAITINWPDRVRALAVQGAPFWGGTIPQSHRVALEVILTLLFPGFLWDEITGRREFRTSLMRLFFQSFHQDFEYLEKDQRFVALAKEDVRKFSARAAQEVLVDIFHLDFREKLTKLDKPVLLIDGSNILYPPIDTTDHIAKLLPQKPEIKRIPGGHLAPWVHPRIFVNEILDFFRRVRSKAA